jgi:hypothetical protein
MALETQRSRLKSNGKVNDMLMTGQVTNRRAAGSGGNKVAVATSNVVGAKATHINATDGPLSTLTPGNMMEMQYYNPVAGLLPVTSGIPSVGNRRGKLSRGSSVDEQQPSVVCGRSGLYVDFTV